VSAAARPVLVAPDKFKGTLTAHEAALAIGRGLATAGVEPIEVLPLADGGEGTMEAIARARGLSRATMRAIRQNLFFAFVYNAIGVPVAAGLLYPFVGVLISPIWASAAMTFSSVSVIGNALRLRRVGL